MTTAPSPAPPDRPPPDERGLRAGLLALTGLVALHNLVTFLRRLQRPNAIASTDFTSYWTGWWMLLHGQAQSLYDAAAQTVAQATVMGGHPFDGGLMAFLYPPHVALAGLPLGALADRAGEAAAYGVWTAANLLFAARLAALAARELDARGGTRALVVLWTFAFYPVLSNLALGQLSLPIALGAFELFRAVRAGRPTRAALWLAVLSIKPQLLPAVTLWLIARRQWTVLALAATLGAGLAAAAAVAFGPHVWVSYFTSVHALERFFGPGPPLMMPNVRGLLLRVLGAGSGAVDPIVYTLWAGSLAGLAVLLERRRAQDDRDPRDGYALTLAVATVASPHLFHQDLVLTGVAFALHLAALRARGAPARPFATFVLAWPPLYLLARLTDLTATHAAQFRTPVDPLLVGQLALAALLVRSSASAAAPTLARDPP
jgi:hypothetical protein